MGAKCEFFEQCEYLEQFDDKTQVRIFTHASLALDRGYLDKKRPDMAIIDESFFSVMIDNQMTTLNKIERYIKNKSLSDVIIDSLDNKKPLLANLRKTFGDNVIKVFKNAAKLLRPKLPNVTSATDANDAKRKLCGSGIKEKQDLALMLDQLKAEIEKFQGRKNSTTVRLVNNEVVIANRHELKRF